MSTFTVLCCECISQIFRLALKVRLLSCLKWRMCNVVHLFKIGSRACFFWNCIRAQAKLTTHIHLERIQCERVLISSEMLKKLKALSTHHDLKPSLNPHNLKFVSILTPTKFRGLVQVTLT